MTAEITGSIDPTREQFKAFIQNAPQDTPIHMLNLIRLRKDAAIRRIIRIMARV